jgi:dGTPase
MLDSSKLEVVRFYPIETDEGYEYDRESAVTTAPVRRLQQKTQVYPLDIKASARSRLTHSLEVQCRARMVVAEIAKRNSFYCDNMYEISSICETAALVHDVGNPPFGHFGENVISNYFSRRLGDIYRASLGDDHVRSAQWDNVLFPDLISFDGNAQNLRILHSIQKLNLSAQVLGTCIKVPYLVDESTDSAAGCFYSESILFQFIRDALELDVGEHFELVHILEYADNICYALADVEDSIDRGLISLEEMERELPGYCTPEAEELFRRIICGCTEKSSGFIEYFRINCLASAIGEFADNFASSVRTGFTDEFEFDYRGVENSLIMALIKYAREKIFKKKEIESLEITGNSALLGLLKAYSKLLCLSREDFSHLLNGGELSDPILSRLFHRISHRVLETYVESVADDALYFDDPDEKELYFRVRLMIDYITGMTDTYIQAEFALMRGLNY